MDPSQLDKSICIYVYCVSCFPCAAVLCLCTSSKSNEVLQIAVITPAIAQILDHAGVDKPVPSTIQCARPTAVRWLCSVATGGSCIYNTRPLSMARAHNVSN